MHLLHPEFLLLPKGSADHAEINFPCLEETQCLRGRGIGHYDLDTRILFMESFQERKQIKAQRHIAGADMHLPQLQIQHLPDLLHTLLDFLISLLHVGIEKLSLPGKPDAPGRPLKEGRPQTPLQGLQRLAYRRLGYGQLICGACYAPQPGGIVKYFKIFQIFYHALH